MTSARGALTLAAEASDELRPGETFVPMHWGSLHVGGRDALGVNAVTLPTFDRISRQPELKHCAVRIAPVALPWKIVAFAYAEDVLALLHAAREHLPRYAYASCVLVGREREGVLFRAADGAAPRRETVAELDALFGLDDPSTLAYDDARRGVGRRVLVRAETLHAARLAGDVSGEAFLREIFEKEECVAGFGAQLLAPSPRAAAPRGQVVCSCWNIAETEIAAFLANAGTAPDLAALQGALRCGTRCGSCVPELKRLVTAARAAA